MCRSVARFALGLLCGLALIVQAGCADLFSSRHAVSRPEPPKNDSQVPSRSDQPRTDFAGDASLPASLQELQPQLLRPPSLEPSDTAPTPQSADEPDPRAVIDWLLKERR